ncbi:MAG: hypothetical protein AABX14_03505 [Candidatus Aenigmatarchaeota archaeon]
MSITDVPNYGVSQTERHAARILEAMEQLYIEGRMPKDGYLAALRGTDASFPVHDFYRRMFERDNITQPEYALLLKERLECTQQEIAKAKRPLAKGRSRC